VNGIEAKTLVLYYYDRQYRITRIFSTRRFFAVDLKESTVIRSLRKSHYIKVLARQSVHADLGLLGKSPSQDSQPDDRTEISWLSQLSHPDQVVHDRLPTFYASSLEI
jgi:hypothetical protein